MMRARIVLGLLLAGGGIVSGTMAVSAAPRPHPAAVQAHSIAGSGSIGGPATQHSDIVPGKPIVKHH